MTTPGLGRVPSTPDERDKAYPLRAILDKLPQPLAATGYRYWWENGAWLDQGQTGTCVGHGWAHEIEDSPVTHPHDVVDPFRIYDLATTLDPWSDNDHDINAGTSVRAGAQAAQQLGYVGNYYWAQNIDDVKNAVLNNGPAVIGFNWYEDWFDPAVVGEHSIIAGFGSERIAGGHCTVLNGVNVNKGFFRMKNSWGRGWADDGHCRITFEVIERVLFAEDGECVVPTDVRPV